MTCSLERHADIAIEQQSARVEPPEVRLIAAQDRRIRVGRPLSQVADSVTV